MFPGKQLSTISNNFVRDLQTKEANVSRETFASFSHNVSISAAVSASHSPLRERPIQVE
jgi:hypothetical protein